MKHECEYNSDLHYSFHSLIRWHALPMPPRREKKQPTEYKLCVYHAMK